MQRIKLPGPRNKSSTSVEEALARRRSVREYVHAPITLDEASQLLWSAQGITEPQHGLRTAPSAGALYPLEIYLVAGNVEGLATGIYKYRPSAHELLLIDRHDAREELSKAALGQDFLTQAPAVIVICGIVERTSMKYGKRATQYVCMEVGHVAENVYLQAVALDLGTVVIGSFHEDDVKKCLNINDQEVPFCIMPIGKVPPLH